MAITVQIKKVRDKIIKSGAAPGQGMPSSLLLGRLFHEVFADLTGPDEKKNLVTVLDETDASKDDWERALINHAYQHLVGPRLHQHQAALHATAEKALNFWDATQNLCRWLAKMLWQAKEHGVLAQALEAISSPEEELHCELRAEGWTDSVVLTGRADAIWRVPATQEWCLIELKTGCTMPEADLAQVCLYHQMLSAMGAKSNCGIALVSFTPSLAQVFLPAEKIAEAQKHLLHLIGELAGVLPAPYPQPVTPVQPIQPPVLNGNKYLEQGKQLERAFTEYGAEIKAGKPVVGPTFLRFPIELGTRVRVRTVEQQVQNVQARLKLKAPPRVSLEEGRVAIDLQRPDREVLYFSQIHTQLPAADELLGNARVPVGVDLSNELHLADFRDPENAHMLVAGTTGSGKSEWLRAAVAGLILTNTPATLRLAFADPKRSAFQLLKNSPYLYAPIAYEEENVFELLSSLVEEMETRYQKMGEVHADTLSDLIRRTQQSIPRIFFICDEFAYLMTGDLQTRKRLELLIKKLGFKARAAGIHMILATQQPNRKVITGTIQTNLSAKVGLKLEPIESRILLGNSEAEALLGKGDLLYKCIGDQVRLQSPYLPEEELKRVFGHVAAAA